ncbi:MAG TPA: type III-B CRISPR module RAMP protein Cmr6, partial [Urbifossiella sp.]|nr:type III-B CRISPR module RAMP protein Cmr6 [Urbifossiella sp.]
MAVPVATGVAARVKENTHPGLLIDKYVDSWHPGTGNYSERVQKPTVQAAADLCRTPPPGLDWADLFARHAAFLAAARAAPWNMVTAGPLALHLSRASALENAGLCLHRVYGFAYLPGTGLKGMARSYAETVWLPAQTDQGGAREAIRTVFGHVKDKGDASGRAGAVVFHDAWPAEWPRLVPDLLNNHHKGYYGGTDAPGDWDEPNMVSFLAVAPGTRFRFALAKRRSDGDNALLSHAREWLKLALIDEGAGAKTAAGYGGFRLADATEQEPARPAATAARATHETTLELVSPAFLAGPNQQPDDCELRPATLRGLLRWWWRTLHAGFVDVPTLRRMEAAVWGDTGTGGAVRVTVEPLTQVTPLSFDKKQAAVDHRLPKPPDGRTTQGLVYASYGMDERKGRRAYLPPGTKWKALLTARPGRYVARDPRTKEDRRSELPAALLLTQGKAALTLLCHLGGVGSKSRNGFGSFADQPGASFADLKQAAAAFRTACGVGRTFRPSDAESLSIEEIVSPQTNERPWLEVPTPWKNSWFALDQIGAAMQGFAQRYKHNPAKLALGLPREIDGPKPKPTRRLHGSQHSPLKRHAAPVFYHLTCGTNGTLTV